MLIIRKAEQIGICSHSKEEVFTNARESYNYIYVFFLFLIFFLIFNNTCEKYTLRTFLQVSCRDQDLQMLNHIVWRFLRKLHTSLSLFAFKRAELIAISSVSKHNVKKNKKRLLNGTKQRTTQMQQRPWRLLTWSSPRACMYNYGIQRWSLPLEAVLTLHRV